MEPITFESGVRTGEYVLHFEDNSDVGDVFVERGRIELRETPERRDESLAEIRALLKKEADLFVPLDNELFLLSYLRACKFYPESALARMKRFYKFKNKYPKYAENLLPSLDRNVFEQCILTVLPMRDQHGRRTLLVEAGSKWKPKNCSLVELIRGVMLVVEAAILEPKTQISGVNVLIDLEGLSLNHVWQFSPGFASMLLEWAQECVPLRIKSVHILNQPYVFNMLFAIFKPFLQEKLRNRIHFHGEDRVSLMKHFDTKCIPTQYGGDMYLPVEQGVNLFHYLCVFEDKYERTSKQGYIISKKKNRG